MHKFLVLLFCCVASLTLSAQVEQANLLGQWNDPTLVGSAAYDNAYNEIWGIEVNGHEYAVIGSTRGTHFIDVTDPRIPTESFFIEGKSAGSNIIHRDYHDYNGYLYAAADEGLSSLQILDISNLPDTVIVVYDDDDLFRTAHNIFIDSANAKLYTCATRGGTSSSSALRVYDISTPENPKLLSSHSSFGGYNVGHVHDAYVENDTAYLNCGGNGLVIASFKDTLDPVVLTILQSSDYPSSGYNHSGWLSNDKRYYYMADETHGTDVKVFDLIDILNPTVVATFNTESGIPSSIPHNLMAKCNHLYISYYYEGLQVFDISERGNPVRVLEYDTYHENDGFSYKGAWGVYPFLPSGKILVSDMQTGLYIFSPPADDECHTNTSTATSLVLNNSVKIWPTIVDAGVVQVQFENEITNPFTMNLCHINGQSIYSKSWQNSAEVRSIEIPATLRAGMYVLSIQIGGQTMSQKILIP